VHRFALRQPPHALQVVAGGGGQDGRGAERHPLHLP
jgi:hypothetical protein